VAHGAGHDRLYPCPLLLRKGVDQFQDCGIFFLASRLLHSWDYTTKVGNLQVPEMVCIIRNMNVAFATLMVITMRLSFYNTAHLTPYDGQYITRSGRTLAATTVAVDPSYIEWDTHSPLFMAIPTLETPVRTVDDTGSKVIGPVVDVFYEGNWKEALDNAQGIRLGRYKYVICALSADEETAQNWAKWYQNRPFWYQLVALEQSLRERERNGLQGSNP